MEKKKRLGNPNMRKGMPSVNPKGKSAGREVLNKQIVDGLREALEGAEPGGPSAYFTKIAREKPELFVGMLTKIMPSESAVAVTVDMGKALEEASDRLQRYEAKTIEAKCETVVPMDITPIKETEPK